MQTYSMMYFPYFSCFRYVPRAKRNIENVDYIKRKESQPPTSLEKSV